MCYVIKIAHVSTHSIVLVECDLERTLMEAFRPPSINIHAYIMVLASFLLQM